MDDHWVRLSGGMGAAEVADGVVYLAMALRIFGQRNRGPRPLDVVPGSFDRPHPAGRHEWLPPADPRSVHPPVDGVGFWQGAIRDPRGPVLARIVRRDRGTPPDHDRPVVRRLRRRPAHDQPVRAHPARRRRGGWRRSPATGTSIGPTRGEQPISRNEGLTQTLTSCVIEGWRSTCPAHPAGPLTRPHASSACPTLSLKRLIEPDEAFPGGSVPARSSPTSCSRSPDWNPISRPSSGRRSSRRGRIDRRQRRALRGRARGRLLARDPALPDLTDPRDLHPHDSARRRGTRACSCA